MKKRRILSALIAGITAVSALGSSVTSYVAGTKEGKVLNIYAWNEEFKGIFESYAADICEAEGVKVKWTIVPAENLQYQNKVDKALKNSGSYRADKKIDIFLVEPDYSEKYIDSDYVLPISKLGVTEKDTKSQYNFTKELMMKGKNQMGVTRNACSGVFLYRRSIAKKVLGTSDPKKVQKYVRNWEMFDKTAAKMAKNGYSMTAGYSDTYRCFSQNATTP